ncbi:MAG: flagellin [Salinisphaeraceae bacterium]|jgi:flagellin|nr:flagellin [Salinisphaeraceae bacterium]
MQVINTNLASLNAQRNLGATNNAQATALERLSTGLRINSAKDDAAGLAISERFTAQIRGLNQAVRNANDGVSLAQTAEGALDSVTDNLQRIRELSVQSANATNSSSDRAALQAEVSELLSEIDRVASQTAFNGVSLLDGSFSSQTFQVGANAGETISIDSIVDSRTTSLGSNVLTTNTQTTLDTGTANGIGAETDLTITTNAGTTGAIAYGANASAAEIASAINTAAAGVGVTATASNETTLSGLSDAGTVSFTLGGLDAEGNANTASISAEVTDTSDLSSLVAAINGQASTTGITATFTDSSSKDSITLTTSDGRDISIGTFGVGGAVTGETIDFGDVSLDEGDSGVQAGTVELSSTKGQISLANAETDVFASASAVSSFNSASLIDVSTADGASGALNVIDAALSSINSGRADLGAVQNRFESVVSSLQNTSENLSAARSQIQDADFAAETAALTKAQVLQQAGISILAQANAAPQSVLSLLQ